jgi:hypothetical protein
VPFTPRSRNAYPCKICRKFNHWSFVKRLRHSQLKMYIPSIGWYFSNQCDLLAKIKKSTESKQIQPSAFTQYPRMIPFRKPHCDHISFTTSRRRLSVAEPYWACIRTLNISTGLAKTAFAAPAIAPDNPPKKYHENF